MPVFGILTQKRNPAGLKHENRYYVLQDVIEDALSVGVAIVEGERLIHGEEVNFYNVHAWLPGANPNVKRNQVIDLPGAVATSNSIKPEIVARYFFSGAGNNNPHFKDYRVQVNASSMVGPNWSSGYFTNLDAFEDYFALIGVPFCTRQGELLASGTFSNEYHFRQLSKRWYNRGV